MQNQQVSPQMKWNCGPHITRSYQKAVSMFPLKDNDAKYDTS
jgi:hypothetical protein